ncbi:hypothetical protein FB446DRAFT_819617 [Lentinula raphanica]|nr:hypothetical protein FB446DRAFT_819617 [Lentinula raphanica]
MLLFSLERHFPIAFAFLSIFESISVTFSAAIPPLADASSNELIRAPSPPKIATLSFVRNLPEDFSVQGAYRVFLDKDDTYKFQKLVEEQIAKDMQPLVLQNQESSVLTADDLIVEPESPLYLFRDPDPNAIRYFVPYNIASTNENFQEGMTLRMLYVDKDVGKPQTKLYRRTNEPNSGSTPSEGLLDIASRSKSVIATFTTEAEVNPDGEQRLEPKPVELAGGYKGLLDIVGLSAEIVLDAVFGTGVHTRDVQVEGRPSVLATSKDFIIPYKITYGSDIEVHGQLEVSKYSRTVQLRRIGRTPTFWQVGKDKLDYQSVHDIIEMGMETQKKGGDNSPRLPQLMEHLMGRNWKESAVRTSFVNHYYYTRPNDPYKREVSELLANAAKNAHS